MKVYLLPPEAGDGQHHSVFTDDDFGSMVNALRELLADTEAGSSITIQVQEMTNQEIEDLPDL